ncbi:MAG: YggT family protein [Hahellaceae bacterium]|jgi:YggT family protein|nr:YggT family protein [Hahellaceae bacterium]MCP5209651.1 YggT family protein [Hahellaceae bacterium]
MLAQIFISTIQILSAFYMTIVLLRFLLQVAKADFYNPISQFVVKATNPLLLPLRKIIPGFGGFDIAGLVLALLLQALVYFLIFLAAGTAILNPLTLLGWSAITLLALVTKIYFWAIIAVIILSWVAQGSYHPAIQLLHQLTEPIMAPFRKLLPPLGGLDLSPILVFLILNVVEIVIAELSRQVGLPAIF